VWREKKGLGMNLTEWELTIPECIRGDAIWKVEAYRLALFLADLAWPDTTRLVNDRRTREIADQLYRSSGKISAQVAEGYSRTTGKDRALFYAYALGSTRESRDWYFKARHVLGDRVADHRMELTTSIIRLLLVMLRKERQTNRRLGQTG